jgi:hypothetical protein
MLNLTEIAIDHFVDRLRQAYRRAYGSLEPEYPEIISWAGHMALENIANSDALYHNVEHTILVTLVGQEILHGKHLVEGGVTPRDWMHFMLSLVCHDIGYVRGVCPGDRPGSYVTGVGEERIEPPDWATDAFMSNYHVDRGKRFVQARFGDVDLIDAHVVSANIELTRFPVPNTQDHADTRAFPGLVRAADLIGQLADPGYLRKLPALFHELDEMGAAGKIGYENPADLRRKYAGFFWERVEPFLGDGIRHLNVTQEGKRWLASLRAHVFAVEHGIYER